MNDARRLWGVLLSALCFATLAWVVWLVMTLAYLSFEHADQLNAVNCDEPWLLGGQTVTRGQTKRTAADLNLLLSSANP